LVQIKKHFSAETKSIKKLDQKIAGKVKMVRFFLGRPISWYLSSGANCSERCKEAPVKCELQVPRP
jgi:hypothetical protein